MTLSIRDLLLSSSTAAAPMDPPSLALASTTAAQVHDQCQALQKRFRQAIETIEAQEKLSSWHDTFGAVSQALGEAAEASVQVTLPAMTHQDASVRQASTQAKDALKTLFDETLGRRTLYRVLQAQQAAAAASSTTTTTQPLLTREEEHLTSLLLAAFVRNGCALADPQQQRALLDTRQRTESICSAFCLAINEDATTLTFAEDELEGVPNLDQFPKATSDDNGSTTRLQVPLKAPFTVPLLQFAQSPATRKAVATALATKCQEANTERFLQTLQLRHECAQLLGYESHAHSMLESKMAQTPQAAESFLLELLDRLVPQCREDLARLRQLKRQETGAGGDNVTLEPWDVSYYTRQFKATTLGVDEAELQQYFPLDHVKREILSIYQELLHVRFVLVPDAATWHDDVECFAVLPAKNDGKDEHEPLGHFFLDLHPRPGKYSHQCVYPLRPSYCTVVDQKKKKTVRVRPACVNLGNLSRGTNGQPSLLRFREVETFFHEFGHVMHCVLAQSEHSLQAWAWSAVPWPGGVEQDFLEVPSMMLENFVWQPEILQRLSHNKDGQSLPKETMEALQASRFVLDGYSRCRYLAMALYDLKVHSGVGPYLYKGATYDAVQLYEVMMTDLTGIAPIPGSFAVASWFHPMMGYDAGYYSYIWSETYAADLFREFETLAAQGQSVMDAQLGQKYRKTILAPCAMRQGNSLLQDFLGRPASNEAFLKRIVNSS